MLVTKTKFPFPQPLQLFWTSHRENGDYVLGVKPAPVIPVAQWVVEVEINDAVKPMFVEKKIHDF